ncbi:MAG: shikimate dehydrogenase [Desulfosudaceae bacterium]
MRVDANTDLFCVFGEPVAHSKSPVMHNAAFAETRVNGVYVALAVNDIGAAMAAVRTLGISGASVTIPHKVSIMEHLDEVDETARKIGAVNTVINRNGHLRGVNTDWQGAARALSEKTEISGKQVLVLGAGGAARAVAYGIVAAGGRLLIANRTASRGEKLAEEFGGRAMSITEAESLVAEGAIDILINTTPVGMTPNEDHAPLSGTGLKQGMTVMDIVYNPLETGLLKMARAAGCRIVDGATMFVYQGACQFELWTGVRAPLTVMRRVLLNELATDNSKNS